MFRMFECFGSGGGIGKSMDGSGLVVDRNFGIVIF